MKGTVWCLHGAVGMAEDWKGFSVPGWSVKRVDLWRFLDCCPMSMPEFGAALNREVEATEGVNVLLGYSMGGRLALHALLEGGVESSARCPWDAAVIVSAHPGLEDEKEKLARRAKDAEWGAMALGGDWDQFLEAWNGQGVLNGGVGSQEGGMKDRRSLVMRRQAVARSFMDWTLGGQESLWDHLGKMERPMLWVVGEKDEKFRGLGELLVSRIQGAEGYSGGPEIWTAPGAGHRVPWEVGEAFGNKVGEFLERAVS